MKKKLKSLYFVQILSGIINLYYLMIDPNPDLFTNDYNDISWNNTILSDKA